MNLPKLILFVLIAFLFAFQAAAQNYLISAEKVASYSAEDLDSIFDGLNNAPRAFTPVRNGVDVYEVMYASHWHDRSVIKASGLYYVPTGATAPAPMVAVHHGTTSLRRDTVKFSGHQALCTIFAADGYAVVYPDYIGLGRGEKFHLYHHVETEAMATIDFIRAANEINETTGLELSDQLFLTGYSQGGHAAMAVHKVMQEQFPSEFTVTASAPLSGAYDLDGVQSEVMDRPYSHPGYLPYLLVSLAEAGGMGNNPSAMIQYPYDTIVPWLFTGNHKMKDLNPFLPEVPRDMIKPELLVEYEKNPDFPMRRAMEANSVDNWKPEAPVLMCYCKNDEQVSYKNALIAYDNMQALGASNIRKKKVARKFGHGKCAPFAYMYAKLYFDQFRKGKTKGRFGSFGKKILIRTGIFFTRAKN